MEEAYDYLVLRAPDAVAAVELRRQLLGPGSADVGEAGGRLIGVWDTARGIGFASDEVVALVGWPGSPPATAPRSLVADAEVLVEERLQATARPVTPEPFEPVGVVAHRWFELRDPADLPEFVRLSDEAWGGFEAAYDTAPLGLFRAAGGRLLLLTRYASVGEWERSRGTATAESGPAADAGRRFARRRQLTRASVVRLAPFAPA